MLIRHDKTTAAALALVAVFLSPSAASAVGTPTTNIVRPGTVPVAHLLGLRLSSLKRSFVEGEPILLKVEVENDSAETLLVQKVVAWKATSLIVLRDGMDLVKPISPAAPIGWKFPGVARLQPGDSYTYQWIAPGTPQTVTDYSPLTYWGYPSLRPGHYTVIAVPGILGGLRPLRKFQEDPKTQSNRVEITITA